MQGMFEKLETIPPDPILGLMSAFRDDPREGKVDLGVGVYKDPTGRTPIMKAVREAERALVEKSETKTYEGPRGNPEFCGALSRLVVGEEFRACWGDNLVTFATPGGTGALGLATALVKRTNDRLRVWTSEPTWSNHDAIVRAIGADLGKYDHRAVPSGKADIEPILSAMKKAKTGDALMIQGPCHNPTGVDLNLTDWIDLGVLCGKRGIIPILDVAYHGLGVSLDEDRTGISALLAQCPQAIVAYSCSKNFGLYRERTGCLLVKTDSKESADSITSNLAHISRAFYSMPPAHGAAIVSEILTSASLRSMWESELNEMSMRIRSLRARFAKALVDETDQEMWSRLGCEQGMFSVLPLRPNAAKDLASNNAIYLPDSGRINIAGLPASKLHDIARHLACFLAPSGNYR